MDEWPLWAGAYLGIGVFAGLMRLLLLKKTRWREEKVKYICRFGPAAVILIGTLAITAVTPPYDSRKWGLLSLILPTFLVPLIGVCYLGVWGSSSIWPAASREAA